MLSVASWLTAIGLVLGVVGALLMFRFGVPMYPVKSSAGTSSLLLEESDEKEKRRVERADPYRERWSRTSRARVPLPARWASLLTIEEHVVVWGTYGARGPRAIQP